MSGTSGSTGSSSASGQPAAGASGAGAACAAGAEPQRVSVQHVLIGFRGSVPGKNITRTQDEAKTLAYDILNRAKGGADFDQLVRQHTDDSPPGIYGMSNKGVQPAQGEYARDRMVAAFGDVGFKLPVGGYGIADHEARTSPLGYHVIKRVK